MPDGSVQLSPPPWARRALEWWHKLEVNIAVTAFSLIAVILIYDVLEREFIAPLIRAFGFDASWLTLYGSQKIATYLLIIGAFTGIGVAAWTGAQLVPKVAFNAVPEAWNVQMNRLADVLTALFLVGAAYYGWVFVQGSYDLGLKSSGALSVQIWPVQAAVPLGFASAALRYLAFAVWPSVRPGEKDGSALE
mgnify:CR=1 FL=1